MYPYKEFFKVLNFYRRIPRFWATALGGEWVVFYGCIEGIFYKVLIRLDYSNCLFFGKFPTGFSTLLTVFP